MARNWLDPKMADFKRQLFRKLSGAWYSLHLKPWTVLRKNQQEYYSDVYTIRKNHSKWCKENHMWWNFFSNKKEFHHLWYVLENTKNFSFFYSEVNKLTKNQGQANEYFSEERTQEKKDCTQKSAYSSTKFSISALKNFQIVWWSLHDFSDMRNDFYFQIVVLIYTRNLWKKACAYENFFVPQLIWQKRIVLPRPAKKSLTSWIQF